MLTEYLLCILFSFFGGAFLEDLFGRFWGRFLGGFGEVFERFLGGLGELFWSKTTCKKLRKSDFKKNL